MKIINTYIAMMVENSPSTLFKIYELSDGTYIRDVNMFYEIISNDDALKYKLNMSNYLQNKKII